MEQRAFITVVGSLAMLLCAAPFGRAETLDRIAVTVGRHVISEQDIVRDIRLSAFIDTRQPEIGGTQKRKAADRLINQYLVLEDAALTRTPLPSTADVAALLAPIKARYASDQEYRNALTQARVTDAELAEHLLAGLRMLRYTDLRFRPEVEISDEALHAYYGKLVASADHAAAPPSFEASRNDIEKLLTDQETMQALDRWLSMTRGETAIVFREEAFK
jgi:hypothetical protein